MPQSSWMGHGTQSLGHWVACLVFWRNNSASSPAFASLRQLSQLLLVMLTVMFLVQKHLIWIARQWLHSTFYRFSLCFVSVWPFFRVGAESRWLWGWEVDGAEQTHLLSCKFVSNSGPLVALKGSPYCPAVSLAPSARTIHRILAPATAEGQLLSRRKWVSAGTNLLPVFLFCPFLSNGKQSEQFLRMRDINLSAAIYTVLVTASV